MRARAFLGAATNDAAHPVFTLARVHGMRLYGMRHGEITALRWEDIDFDPGRLVVRASLVRTAGRLMGGPVKTRAGARALPLVPVARTALLSRCSRQADPRAVAGEDRIDIDYVFTTRSGRPVEPSNLSRSFD